MPRGTKLTDYNNYDFNYANDAVCTQVVVDALPQEPSAHPLPIKAMRQGDDIFRKVRHRESLMALFLAFISTTMEYGAAKQLLCDNANMLGNTDSVSEFLKALRTAEARIG